MKLLKKLMILVLVIVGLWFLKGKTRQETERLFARFHSMLTSSPEHPIDLDGLGRMAVFSGVREYPIRIKCATLAWYTLLAALDEKEGGVSTE